MVINIPSNSESVKIKQLEAEIQRLKVFETQVMWENRLFANPTLSPTHKLTLRESVFGKHKLTPDSLTTVYIPAIAQKIGLSVKTTGKSLQFLAETGALRRETDTKTDENGKHITRVSLGLTTTLRHPERIIPPTPRNHGGKRVRCHDCGSDNLVEQRTLICLDCGATQSKITRLVNVTDGQLDQKYHVTDTSHDHDAHAAITMHDHDSTHHNHDDNNACAITALTADNGKDTPGTIAINGNPDSTLPIAPPIANLTPLKTRKEPTDNLTAGFEKPPTPPKPATATFDVAIACSSLATDMSDVPPAILPMQTMKERPQPGEQPETERDLDQETAQLLLDMAGDTQEHIVMNSNPNNPKKYLTVQRPLTVEDMRLHLTGKRTLGATLRHNDGTTRSLCFDVDDTPTDRVSWLKLKEEAALLIAEGYKPLLEPSPAGRGGHLWLIFSERVNALAAYSQVCEVAPALKDVAEYWPGRGNQKVRLPAGRYVTPTFSAWTTITDTQGIPLATNGVEGAAAVLLSHQTPADLIPTPQLTDEHEPEEAPQPERRAYRQPQRSATTQPDEYHRAKYGNHQMWVAWPSEQYLIDRFNEQHTIDELAQRERNGMINASLIGRPERTASVGVTKDGGHFTDFGAGARKADGTPDGGDAFEFYIRLHHLDKSEALRELGAALNREASRELLRAARAGELPPAWVMDIITDKGREVYNQNATRHGHNTLEEHLVKHRGVDGFSDVGKDEKQGVRLPWQVEQEEKKQGIPEDFTTNTPCKHCGCCLYRNMLGSVVCVRCYPPRGYHLYSDLIDAKYPRRKRWEFS